jgi:hypothetical protein
VALQNSALASALKTIFDAMDNAASSTPKDNRWYAEQMAKAITDQIKTAGIPAGSVIVSVSGQATGTPNAAEIKVS